MYGVSDSGWMDTQNFMEWFMDGHYSHLSLDLIQYAKSQGIHLFCFPPHLTHILQPLDVGVYGPVKMILKDHKFSTCAQNVIKEDFPGNSISSVRVYSKSS